MKKFILTIAIALGVVAITNAQVKPKENPIILPSTVKTPSNDKFLKDTVINDVPTKLYLGKNGGKYAWVTAKVSGNVYKRYFKAKTPKAN